MTGFPTWDGVPIDPDLLDNYGYVDPLTYGGFTLPRYLSYMLAGLNEISTVIDESAGLLVGNSSSNVSVGTGAKSFTATTGRSWAPGMFLLAYRTTDVTQFVSGTVTSYDEATGALVIDSTDSGGSGSYTNWTITLSGKSAPTSRWYTGSGAPAGGLGSDFDLYLNTANGDVYYKTSGVWAVVANIKSTWYVASGVPSSGLGNNTDLYLNDVNGDVYQKSNGSWVLEANIRGPQGMVGTGSTVNVARNGSVITAAPRPTLNFIGDVSVADNPGATRADITVSAQPPSFLLMAQGII